MATLNMICEGLQYNFILSNIPKHATVKENNTMELIDSQHIYDTLSEFGVVSRVEKMSEGLYFAKFTDFKDALETESRIDRMMIENTIISAKAVKPEMCQCIPKPKQCICKFIKYSYGCKFGPKRCICPPTPCTCGAEKNKLQKDNVVQSNGVQSNNIFLHYIMTTISIIIVFSPVCNYLNHFIEMYRGKFLDFYSDLSQNRICWNLGIILVLSLTLAVRIYSTRAL